MKLFALLTVVAVSLVAGCSKQESPPPKASDTAASGNPLTAPVDYLGAAAKAKNVAEKVVDVTAVNQAVQLFYAQEDRFPKDLNELVKEKYLPSLPAAPAGAQWAYNPQTGAVKLVRP